MAATKHIVLFSRVAIQIHPDSSHHIFQNLCWDGDQSGEWDMTLAFESSLDPDHHYKSSLSWVRFPRGRARDEDSCKGGFEEKPIIGQKGIWAQAEGVVRVWYPAKPHGRKLWSLYTSEQLDTDQVVLGPSIPASLNHWWRADPNPKWCEFPSCFLVSFLLTE